MEIKNKNYLAIEKYAQENYFNEKYYPTTKLIVALFLSFLSFVIPVTGFGYIIVLVCILLSAFFHVFKSYTMQLIKVLVPIILILFIFQLLIVSGNNVLFNVWVIEVTEEAVLAGINYTSIIAAIAASIMLFFNITSTNHMIKNLENSGLPKNAIFVISSTLQFLPQAKEQSDTIIEAQESRGIEVTGSIFKKFKSFIPMIIPLALSTIASNEERILTLESRGFSSASKTTKLYTLEKKKHDYIIQYTILILSILIAIWRIFYGVS